MNGEDDLLEKFKNFPTNTKYDLDTVNCVSNHSMNIPSDCDNLSSIRCKSFGSSHNRKTYFETGTQNGDNQRNSSLPLKVCSNSSDFDRYRHQVDLNSSENRTSSRTDETYKTAQCPSSNDENLSLYDKTKLNETMYFDENNATFILEKFKNEIDNAKQTYGVATPKTVIKSIQPTVNETKKHYLKVKENNTSCLIFDQTLDLEKPIDSYTLSSSASSSHRPVFNHITQMTGNSISGYKKSLPTPTVHDSLDNQSHLKVNSIDNSNYSFEELINALNIYKNIIDMIEMKHKKSIEKYENILKKYSEENELLKNDYRALDSSFSELHHRYEKLRQMNVDIKQNQIVLESQLEKQNELLNLADKRIEELTVTSENLLRAANEEIYNSRTKHESEITLLQTSLKLEQTKNNDLEQSLRQKILQNEELTAICDELLKHANLQ